MAVASVMIGSYRVSVGRMPAVESILRASPCGCTAGDHNGPMQKTDTDPAEIIASAPETLRADFATLDARISEVMSGLPRVAWEGVFWGGTEQHIIGYGEYRYQGRSGASGEWFVVGLAAQKQYLSLYVNAVEDGQHLLKRYATRLGKVKAGSANVSIRHLADVEMDVLLEMIARARELMAG
jgi:hypothetical protein